MRFACLLELHCVLTLLFFDINIEIDISTGCNHNQKANEPNTKSKQQRQ